MFKTTASVIQNTLYFALAVCKMGLGVPLIAQISKFVEEGGKKEKESEERSCNPDYNAACYWEEKIMRENFQRIYALVTFPQEDSSAAACVTCLQ